MTSRRKHSHWLYLTFRMATLAGIFFVVWRDPRMDTSFLAGVAGGAMYEWLAVRELKPRTGGKG